jgi:hypothetical protein
MSGLVGLFGAGFPALSIGAADARTPTSPAGFTATPSLRIATG